MLERNKSYEMKEWFIEKFAKENGFDMCSGWLVAIMKETEKEVYAMVQVCGASRKCTWIPKSCLESYEVGNDGFCNHHETVFEEDYNKCVEIFKDHCFMYDLVQSGTYLKGGDKVKERFTTARAAQILDVSTNTLKRWYKWYHSDDYQKPIGLKLPEPEISGNGTMFFTMEQIQELHKFQIDLRSKYRGVMAEFNATYQWGQRGTKILNIGKQFKKRMEDNNNE